MSTPLYGFMKKYAADKTVRAHMPGHKGKAPIYGVPEELYSLDITEISGADSLFNAEGIIAESEKEMSRLYGTAATAYSASGSTLCIQAMLALMKSEGRKVFAVRNVHRSFLNAAALLDVDVHWILPHYDGGILSGEIDLCEVEDLLSECAEPSCLYVTSPDYTGKTADIKALAKICHRHGARLLTDNAHGAHLAFFSENIHPIALGADLCCDSAHKMLPALTGAAMLHTSDEKLAPRLKQAMSLFASTSPSYLIMASLDICTEYISRSIRSDIRRNLALLDRLRKIFSERLSFAEGDPFHVTIKASLSGFSGTEISRLLREKGVECEYADSSAVVLLMSPMSRRDDYSRIESALKYAHDHCERTNSDENDFYMELPKKAMTIRQAVFSGSEEIPVEEAEGRICSAVKVPCPPAIPIAASGEIIDKCCINIFKRYGISTVNVVK